MTALPGHPSGDGCDCREKGRDIVDFECAALWKLHEDGYRPLSDPTQSGISLGQIEFHRAAELDDYGATRGALRGSFTGDGSPDDTVRYPNRHPEPTHPGRWTTPAHDDARRTD